MVKKIGISECEQILQVLWSLEESQFGDRGAVTTNAVPISRIFRRSTLGPGTYLVRDDEKCIIPYDAAETILDTAIEHGACLVRHSGMFDKTEQATALPGGYLYEVVSKFSRRGLPERCWVIGTRAVRHVLRLLDFSGPLQPLPEEEHVPADAELVAEWDEFASRDRLARIGASLGALNAMTQSARDCDRNLKNGYYEPITLPIEPSTAKPQPRTRHNTFDPRTPDGPFWTMYTTIVADAYGTYELKSSGELEPHG